MTNKKSFILYTDLRESLSGFSDAEVGQLLRAIFDYVEFDCKPHFKDGLAIAFRFIQTTLDRDQAKWVEERQRRSMAGKKGANARWQSKNDNES